MAKDFASRQLRHEYMLAEVEPAMLMPRGSNATYEKESGLAVAGLVGLLEDDARELDA
jgi:hypothetical protein